MKNRIYNKMTTEEMFAIVLEYASEGKCVFCNNDYCIKYDKEVGSLYCLSECKELITRKDYKIKKILDEE